MAGIHNYNLTVIWTGNLGQGTKDYQAYERSHTVFIDHKPSIFCSSDPAFRGDNHKHNPEELFLASISSCHMLWYLHLCAKNGIIVREYTDNASATMVETINEGGRFTGVVLEPRVLISDHTKIALANELHHAANAACFIANSCNFPILHRPTITVEP